jgi:hypothetical protein
MTTISKIIGIISFFSLLGLGLTYPYELSYKGNEDIKIFDKETNLTSINEVIDRPEFKGKVLYITIWEPFEEHYHDQPLALPSKELKAMQARYKGKNLEFVYITRPDSDSKYLEDDLRKWKAAVKTYQFKGNHFYMNPIFYRSLWDAEGIRNLGLPYYLIADQEGTITNYIAKSPKSNPLSLFRELDMLLKD